MDYFFIGGGELRIAFRLVGVEGTAVYTQEAAVSAFHDATAIKVDPATGRRSTAGHKILIVTEQVADWLGNELIEWHISGNYPLVVEIPAITGRQSGRKTLVDSIREAIGIHV